MTNQQLARYIMQTVTDTVYDGRLTPALSFRRACGRIQALLDRHRPEIAPTTFVTNPHEPLHRTKAAHPPNLPHAEPTADEPPHLPEGDHFPDATHNRHPDEGTPNY